MITQWFIDMGTRFVGWLASLMPTWTPPDVLVNFGSTFNGFFSRIAGLGGWFDFTVCGVCLGLALAAWVTGAGIKLLRAIASYIPLFGGAG